MKKIFSIVFTKLPYMFLLLSGAVFGKDLPSIVSDEIEEIRQTCKDAGGTPKKLKDTVKVLDITGDGKSDYIIDYGELRCEGAESVFAGMGGYSNISLYVSKSEGKVEKSQVLDKLSPLGLEIDKLSSPPVLWVTVRGEECGQKITDNTPRVEYRACKRAVIWNKQAKELRVAPVSQAVWLD